MEKILEKMVEGKINNKNVIGVKYNGKELWRDYYVEYTINVESNDINDSLDTVKSSSSASCYKYLPTINDYGLDSHKYYRGIKIKLKDGSSTSSLSVKVGNIENIIIFYHKDTYKLEFKGSFVYSHRIKELKYINTENFTSMSCMFDNCNSLTSLNLSNFNTSNVTNMEWMFYSCDSLTSLDLSGWDVSSVTDMSLMFAFCDSLKSVKFSNFNTSSVTDMYGMFEYCNSLTSLDLSSFNTSNVTNMNNMFYKCESLKSLDLTSFNTSNVTNMTDMFSSMPSTAKIYISPSAGWELTEGETSFSGKFINNDIL